jgi:hypothetical protein
VGVVGGFARECEREERRLSDYFIQRREIK